MSRAATIRQCVILAGSLATRKVTITREVPKPVLEVGERPLLFWTMRELQRFGVEEFVILTGALTVPVRAVLEDAVAALPKPARLIVAEAPEEAGTAGALRQAREHLDKVFLVCDGDIAFDTNLAVLLRDFATDGPDVSGRMLLAPAPPDDRYGRVHMADGRVAGFAAASDLISLGVVALHRRMVAHCPEQGSLTQDVLPALAQQGTLRGTLGRGFFADTRLEDDLARACHDLPAVLHRPALFLDRDGVLNHDHGYVGFREHWEWVEGALDAVRHATDLGWHVFIVTNQSGIARGMYSEDDARALLAWVCEEARLHGGTIDDWRYCPYHPEGTVPEYRRHSDWRKPGPGMIKSLLENWQLDPARCLMVGDQSTDAEAAAAAGIRSRLFGGGDLLAFLRPLLA